MSYCRFTESSDVYAYECDEGVQFWVAGKADKGLDRLCGTFNEAYQYAKVLRDKYGLNVPDTAIEELRADAVEEIGRMNGIVRELYDENAKLREQIHYLKKGDILHVLTDQELADQQKHEREVQASITALDDENAKMRELVKDMHADVVRLKDELTTFDHKPTQDECVVGMLVLGILGSINDRMRELGMEVES